ncbi:hypothetical protein H112_00501 [Trichophyton rubrum D6]|uniref:Uncharacterized protein n=2 Tax=Trichophyton rubrum TaxID=5551 RepID=A0A178F9Z0_TRIRU|nr:hypothetical protein H100_00499 [Trichophyton rubrum MR850]EZF46523.1 hypothetical protein H102_00500 [Trichophyton rubrum CBS 100081]EZF57084.1 hypothetical protein H103_00499 [Trichophyton rubrum CBS 288.86]EZF67875.1 hypothetical protein H104_00489 [Trichophyton rubrum CBS 289.86]EZF89024.1 hypothetical protein H110_00504 [Trichophyton rubrum MR1448]EZF99903.1 hypothetical protein H113_00504 [Trichophyton rubrum MR1459]EZG10802.1 hypothetical protein H106_00381 [Trichophyton rubrum CBS 
MATSATTTLMTFLVRTPPSTRSVRLFGSWDNFAKGYPMEKDSRTGRGHWRGCHTFTNIICDGHGNPIYPGRDGGLKMGGTYWYYYVLDGDLDYYNESEAWTTSCPLLPGQPLNVLNVPIYLPPSVISHGRNGSASSQLSVPQTMNPGDKYVNPRPPPRPQLPRLVTSPAALAPQEARGSLASPGPQTHGRSFSQPRAASRKFKVGGKLSLDLKLPMSSLAPKSSGLRTAFFNRVSPRSATHETSEKHTKVPEISLTRDTPVLEQSHQTRTKNYHLRSEYPGTSSTLASPCGSPADLVIDDRFPEQENTNYHPNIKTNCHTLDPLYQTGHSKTRSRSRSPAQTPLRNSVDYDADPSQDTTATNTTTTHPSTVEVPCKLDGHEPLSPIDLYSKRLPTLPNSPSSVLDETFNSTWTSTPSYQPLDFNHLQSHFSKSTVDSSSPSLTPSPHESPLLPSGSRFSDCSTDTEIISPCSMTSSSTFNNDSNSPANYSISASTSLDSNLSDICQDSKQNYLDVFGLSNLHIGQDEAKNAEPAFSWMTSDPFSDEKISLCGKTDASSVTINAKTQGYSSNSEQAEATINNMMQELIEDMGYLGDMIDTYPEKI